MYNKPYPKEISDWIKENVKGSTVNDLAKRLNEKFGTNITGKQLSAYKKNHHLQSGLDMRFKSGGTSWTKGKSPATYIKDPQKLQNWKNTWFKKGQRPKNTAPVGTEIEHEQYIWVKIAEPNVWKPKHIVIYESINGPVPEGMVMTFLDGDTHNFDADNMMLISKSEHSTLNSRRLRTFDPEINKAQIGVIRLNNAIRSAYEKQAN